uniref:Ig-like domain-containing protein n=1 Tax=Wuchereria bancrofti TaxID=6293 RepID=A0A1I8F226_WUCBA
PPKLGADESLEVIIGKSVILNCDLVEQEGIKSTISWLMNGFEMLPTNAQIVLNGRRMYINEATILNEGIYQCRARNSAGESTKNFALNVLAPPTFLDKKYETNIQVTSGIALSLICYVDGHPLPNVQWLHDGQMLSENYVSLSDRNQKLVVQHNDYANHRYTCIASNKAGNISREFLVQMIAPPAIINSDNYPSIEAVEGDSITLECPLVIPINIIDIEWFKNGRPITLNDAKMQISLDKTQLVMVGIQKDAEGTYTCVARNPAGQATREFDVSVIVPPSIIGKAVEYISIVEDESLELECDFEADPIPEIYWSKDGANIDDSVQLLNEKRTALISSVNSKSAGSYRCGIINKAGRAEKTFNVRVIMKPELENANVTALIETLAHQPISLECPLMITSDANISWTKNSIPVIPNYNNDIQILNGGRQFVISDVQLDDQATYSCVARNKAGEASKNYKLSVIAAPTITSRGGLFKVIENNSLVLPCEVEGEPYPTITWIKDGKSALELISVDALSEGQQLKIAQASVEHRGSYVCLARNKVGQAEIGFDVDVITLPAIAEGVKKIIEVIRNDSIVIYCPIIDKRFSGENRNTNVFMNRENLGKIYLNRLKDNQPMKIDGQKYAISQLSRKLHINQAGLPDEGKYSCRVRNVAGESRVDYKLNILLPPEILILDKDKNRTVVENSAITLSCPVTGKPEPVVEWFKDGELLTPINITKRIDTAHIKGNDLKITNVKVINSGRYTCEARNKAGMIEQDILLYVMTPPKIERETIRTEISGKSQSALTINCPAYGRPTPAVTWLKNDKPFYHDSDDDVDRYTCIARNPAGEEKRDFIVKLLEAPTIEGPNILHRMQVNAGRTAIINCPVFGSPEPSIVWLKNGQSLGNDKHFAILNGGRQLEISDTSMTDDAKYTCIATNDIGLADLETYLQVMRSPVITGDKQEVIEVFVNEAKDLFCDASGTEPIDIEWLRDGKTIEFASESRSTTNIPPIISETSSSPPLQTVIPGTGFALECIVQAIPDAQIIWTRNNLLIKPDYHSVFLNNNQTLWINLARDGIDGHYTCTATNKIGQASRDFIIKLTAPPIVDRDIQEIEVDDRRIEIRNARLSDSGNYICVIENEAGEARKTYQLTVNEPPRFLDMTNLNPSIIVGRPLLLDCSVTGTPKPILIWTKVS